MTEYPILLFWDETDRVCVADIPDIRHCSAFAATPEEALLLVREAFADIATDAAERGIALPPPTAYPVLQRAS